VLVDVGYAIGDYNRLMQSYMPDRKFYVVGIDPISIMEHERDCGCPVYPCDVYVQAAIDIKEQEQGVLHRYWANDACSSLRKINTTWPPTQWEGFNNWNEKGQINIVVKKLSTVLKELNFDKIIDIVKIDTQGNDFEVFESLDDYRSAVKFVQLEVATGVQGGLYEGQLLEPEINERMCEFGFDPIIESFNYLNLEKDIVYKNRKY
jgi:FkbM family methyltransferase